MTHPIADLHCDLLCYLQRGAAHSAHDPAPRCSIPQLRQGNVKLQTLAVFTEPGPNSRAQGMAQYDIYQQLPSLYPDHFMHLQGSDEEMKLLSSNKISLLLAFEGASTFCDEKEPIEEGLQRINKIIKTPFKPLYISFTWNFENRFGGGAHSKIGLKEDGKRLLDLLSGTGVAVDLSHTSDELAVGILSYIDSNKLEIPVMASHSNYRSVTDVPRNLPDEIAQEIIARKGIIGLNFYRPFVGQEPSKDFVRHLQHALKIGAHDQIAFGADFFYEEDLPVAHRHYKELFFQEYGDASCYGSLLDLFQRELGLTDDLLLKLSHANMLQFINRTRLR